LLDADIQIVVPEIADYEVRRELLRARRTEGIARLDELGEQLGYLPVDGPVWRRAAELWATARARGFQTAHDKALDGDVILAAQALLACDAGFDATIATDNVAHLERFAPARSWESIGVIDQHPTD
jgi:predicted nucleic acid-binding protein